MVRNVSKLTWEWLHYPEKVRKCLQKLKNYIEELNDGVNVLKGSLHRIAIDLVRQSVIIVEKRHKNLPYRFG